MKKIYSIVVTIVIMSLLTSSIAFAASKSSNIKVTVNNKSVKYEVKPYISGGEVMVSVKETAEALGAKYDAENKSRSVFIHLDMMHVEVIIGSSEFYIHRDADFSGIPQTVKLKAPIKLVKGSIFVPSKTFFESLGMTVKWDSKKKVLSIKKNTIPTKVTYEEIVYDDIKDNKNLKKWYDTNNQKRGISYIRVGKFMYALIGAGEKPTGGFTINIDHIYYSAFDTVTINAIVNPPGDNVRVMMVITYPATLIKIKSDTLKYVTGEVIDAKTSTKEKWITMDSNTVTKMELYNLEQVKVRDISGTEKDDIMKSFNEATIDQNPYIEMITGNILKVTTNDGYVLTFTSYGSETNVIVNFAKDGDNRSFHIVAPLIAKTLLGK